MAQPVATNIRISQNIVTDTTGPAIFLAKTQSNPTKGANTLLKAPRITSATATEVRGTGIAGARVEVYRATLGAGKVRPSRSLPWRRDRWRQRQVAADHHLHAASGHGASDRLDQNTSALAANVKVTP